MSASARKSSRSRATAWWLLSERYFFISSYSLAVVYTLLLCLSGANSYTQKKTTENGVHVKLLEYGQIDGLIRREDIAPCKVVIAREGKNEVVKVLSVNAETGSYTFPSYWLFV
jgi:hypothetical protein